MNRQRYWLLLIALLLVALSWWGVATARVGLVVRSPSVLHSNVSLSNDKLPMLYVAPQQSQRMPGVLVAHGFAGSKQLMLGYAHVLAHAGYAVMLWDFSGNGANETSSQERFSLQRDLDVATAALVSQPEVDPTRLALLGHSMGSGAVMSAAIREPSRFGATIAISPTGAQVTPFAPRNLQLQVGGWENRFLANAQQLLAAAGGENHNLTSGRGRDLVIVPNAEHITILFRNASHQAARRWLDATFGVQNTSSYVDYRMIWYSLHLIAWLIAIGAVAPVLTSPGTTRQLKAHPSRRWFGLLLAPMVASSVILLISSRGDIQSLGGVLVGGAIGIWFLVAGLTWLGILWNLPRPTLRTIGLGVALFALLWVAFGLMAQVVWLQWWLIPVRLKLWPLLSLLCLPWFLASGVAQQGAGVVKRVVWWLVQSLALVGGFFLVVYLVPQLGFIFLIIPVFPIFIAIVSFAASQLNEVWSYAIGSALFFGWAIAAAFPLAV
ncbi:MAG: alpha/beta fold hydrolase [Aphanothece sp. CMT-3BRIN-NPC111]|jgi:dienelactone hydrolase|nr:alpha/beta fold hydrolase [Aphanothece sp. CMT-3BRIN-NPC111]